MNQSWNGQGQVLGRYRLLQLIGRGGMGEVWLAEDSQLRRQVALKMLPRVLAEDTNYLNAFAHEARIAASLDHPNILPVHDFGTQQVVGDELVTYLVLPHIQSGSLRDRIRSANGQLLPIDESLHYLKQASLAIDYAHSKQVLHRDIKPANMLLQQEWLFLADFGIAKILEHTTQHSQTMAGAGTPEYMAPEQIQGHAVSASDLYSLAIIAYQLFVGSVPFQGSTAYDTMMMHMLEPVPSARQFNQEIPPAIENALIQGLAKHPEERPSSCAQFIVALEQGWNSYPQTTNNIDPEATVLAPWKQRRQGHSTSIFSQLPEKVDNPQESVQSNAFNSSVVAARNPSETHTLATDADVVLTPSLPLAQPKQAEFTEEKSRLSRRILLIGGATVVGIAAAAGVGVTLLPRFITKKQIPGPQKLIAGIPLLALAGHSDAVSNVIWDASGRYVATGGADTRVMLWDVAKYIQQKPDGYQTITKPDKAWKFADEIFADCMSWSYDGRTLGVTGVADTKVYLLDALGKSVTPQLYTDTSDNPFLAKDYSSVAWSPTNDTFITGVDFANSIVLWQRGKSAGPIQTFQFISDNKKASLGLSDITWSADGRYITGYSTDFRIPVWDVKTSKMIQNIKLLSRSTLDFVEIERSALKCSPVDKTLLAASDLDAVLIYDFVHNKLVHSLGTDDKQALTIPKSNPAGWVPQVGGITWSPNGRYVAASYGRSNQVYIWDLQNLSSKKKNGLFVQSLLFGLHDGHSEALLDLAWSPDGRYIATASFDKTVIIWRVDGA